MGIVSPFAVFSLSVVGCRKCHNYPPLFKGKVYNSSLTSYKPYPISYAFTLISYNSLIFTIKRKLFAELLKGEQEKSSIFTPHLNVFVKPDEQSQTCLSFAMARTFVQVRAEGKLVFTLPNAAESVEEKRTFKKE